MSGFLGIPSSISSSFAPLVNNQYMRWVGKHGSDSNDGKTIEKAFLTFTAAIAASSAGFTVVCLDNGVYLEGITIPANISVHAPNATIIGPTSGGYGVGTVQFSGDQSTAVFRKIESTGQSAVLKTASGNGGTNWLHADKIVQTGVGSGILNFDVGVVPEPAVIIARVGAVYTGRIGVGAQSSDGGHMHVHVGDIYLTADSAIGIANYGGSSIVGSVEHVVAQGSHTSLIGVWHGVGGGELNLNVGAIDVGAGNVAYDAVAGGTINMFLNELVSGNVGVSGGTLNVTTP